MSKTRGKMPVSQRAKQFMPFEAVSGLREALRMKEHEMGLISREEFSEETANSINWTLNSLEPGDRISVQYFHQEDIEKRTGEILLACGRLTDIDKTAYAITVLQDEGDTDMHGFTEEITIEISDIASISRVDD